MVRKSDEHFFLNAIENQLRLEIEANLDAAVQKFKEHLQERVGIMALRILKQYSISQIGETITIQVAIKDPHA